ncbi:alkaline phosphatase family protein, partial [Verrucomicrobiota bacterium]
IRTTIINMPSTYPACALDGMLVAGFVAVDMNKAVYPESLIPRLTDMGYEIDVNAELAHSDMAQFMDHVNTTLDRRIAFCRWAWEQEAWGCFVFVITETDRVHHFLYPAFFDPSHPFHDAVYRLYGKIDSVIGELTDHLTERDRLVIMSDHGFCNIREEMYVNTWLREGGYLRLAKTPADSYEDIAQGTLAFAMDPCRIYLNRKHAYPMGAVEPGDEAQLLDDLQEKLESWALHEEKVIKHVYRRKQLYAGPMSSSGPDLVAVPNDGFDLKASLKKEETHGRGVFKGMHTQDNAFLITSCDNELVHETPDICDVRRIIETD